MKGAEQQVRIEQAFEQIEESILPSIALMLETLIDASAGMAETNPKALAAELQTLAAELEGLTRAVELSHPASFDVRKLRSKAA